VGFGRGGGGPTVEGGKNFKKTRAGFLGRRVTRGEKENGEKIGGRHLENVTEQL